MKYSREEIIGVLGQLYATSCALKRCAENQEDNDKIQRATNIVLKLEQLGDLLGIDMEVRL